MDFCDFPDDLSEIDHPYDDDIEFFIHAWRLLASSYSGKVGELHLYGQLSKINCETVLNDQIRRIGKTQIHNHVSQSFLEEDFEDLKEIVLFQINKLLKRRIFQRFKRNFSDLTTTDNALTNRNTINKFNDINQIINHQPSSRGYNDERIEATMMAWYRLTKSYSERAEELSNDLYKKLSKIKCKKVLNDQMIRIGKTLFSNRYFKTSSAEDFNDLKETLLLHIDHFERECGLFGELWNELMERLSLDTDNALTDDSMNDIDQEN